MLFFHFPLSTFHYKDFPKNLGKISRKQPVLLYISKIFYIFAVEILAPHKTQKTHGISPTLLEQNHPAKVR